MSSYKSLLQDFAVLENETGRLLQTAVKSIVKCYETLFTNSTKKTIAHWKEKFEAKCPATVAKFIAAYEIDADGFSKNYPMIIEDMGQSYDLKGLLKEFRLYVKNGDTEEDTLTLMAGDIDDDFISVTELIESKQYLTDKYLADKKNTELPATVNSDAEGVETAYIPIEHQQY